MYRVVKGTKICSAPRIFKIDRCGYPNVKHIPSCKFYPYVNTLSMHSNDIFDKLFICKYITIILFYTYLRHQFLKIFCTKFLSKMQEKYGMQNQILKKQQKSAV